MDRARVVELLGQHMPRERSVIECDCGFDEEVDGPGVGAVVTYSYAEHLADVLEATADSLRTGMGKPAGQGDVP